MIRIFLECYGKISSDGVYLCEDVHTGYWKNSIYDDYDETFMGFAKKYLDFLNYWFFKKNIFNSVNADSISTHVKVIPEFTAVTKSVHFYNSVVVFEKESALLLHSRKGDDTVNKCHIENL